MRDAEDVLYVYPDARQERLNKRTLIHGVLSINP